MAASGTGKILFRFLILSGLAGLVVFWVQPARAINFNFSNFGALPEFKKTCDDQDSCLGKCTCQLQLSDEVTLDVITGEKTKNFTWTVYTPFSNESLFSMEAGTGGAKGTEFGNTTNYINGSLNFDTNHCQMTLESNLPNQYINRYLIKHDCNYQQPFCCCKPDAQGGTLADCRRQVNYNGTTPVCQGLSADYRYQQGSEGGQCQKFLDTFNQRVKDLKAIQDKAQQGADVKAEANKLNELPFTTPQDLIGRVIQVLLGFIGSIAFGLYIYAGLLWMTARGEGDKIEKAKQIMFWTSAGVAMMLASYVVVSNLFKLLTAQSLT